MNTPAPPDPPTSHHGGATADVWRKRWTTLSRTTVRWFHAYGTWLVSISWRRFIVLAFGLIVAMAIVHDLPPFTWTFTETSESRAPRIVLSVPKSPVAPVAPAAPVAPKAPVTPAASTTNGGGVHIQIPKDNKDSKATGVDISIGQDGVRITPKLAPAAEAAPTAGAAAGEAAQEAARAAQIAASAASGLAVTLPEGSSKAEVREALAQARRDLEGAVRSAREDAEQAIRDAEEARRDAQRALDEVTRELRGRRTRTTRVGIGDLMMQFSLLWVFASAVLKYTYKGRIQAEVKAAQATETAESESLKRQVVEARMAAMQAQVEPHFLFNTLASIDHLIETDPPRASQMQKNLIALLRASMPTMREASGNGTGNMGVRDLGREVAVIRPYPEILKVRMEERLVTQINVPDGLLSAEFPPMMIQTLVENAIKHGLEPKAEGGSLRVAAEVLHGKLAVTVADTGLGFGRAATAGTGVGLANIRERLQLLYGARASLTVTENQPCGTVVTISVPYKPVEGVGA